MRLVTYDQSYKDKIAGYVLSEEQLRFTKSPAESIQHAAQDKQRHPILALKNEELVSFFVLHEKDGAASFSENPHAVLLRSLSTDRRHQGKGHAKEAFQLLPAFVRAHFPDITEIVLAVNVQNTPAQALYEKCGYIERGNRVMGSKGEMIVMSLQL